MGIFSTWIGSLSNAQNHLTYSLLTAPVTEIRLQGRLQGHHVTTTITVTITLRVLSVGAFTGKCMNL